MAYPIGNAHRWARLLGWTTLGGLLCGFVGPYGSFIGNPISRLCFWVAVFWAGTFILWPSVTSAIAFAERRHLPALFAGAGTTLIACIPLAAFAALICSLFWPVHASGIRPHEWYVLTLILAAPSVALALWLENFRFAGARKAVAGPVRAGAAIEAEGVESAARLPERLLDLVLCLQMEDHHVRAYTSAGSQLYFASMRDAVNQLGARGLQVHRSWWVAQAAVRGAAGDSRSLQLKLSNGIEVPVARARIAAIRAAGWLDPLPAVPTSQPHAQQGAAWGTAR
ncbi:LytTR family DNA-binding domain-containing protein [Sphingomonas crusticola]|uniref:LytTR family DNA-binding domain-containing protein n=1 Tax=Sphingomonas crusticola TaxID=1697973 RepID=UPI000E221D02|nr:LytTR family DNA-binding domain-containing protein [Sphingomonas crusticola]